VNDRQISPPGDEVAGVGLARDRAHNYYLDGQGPYPSVTTILRVLDKSGPLVGWAKRVTAEAAIDHREDLSGWVELGGRDGAVGLLTRAASTVTERAATTGSDIHRLAEAIARGQDVVVSDVQAPYVAAYRSFLDDFAPEFLAAEEMVISVRDRYAGTLDAIARIDGITWLLDYKTSKGVYPETALQLAAYAGADFIGRPRTRQRFAIPPIDRAGVVHLTATGYELVPFDLSGALEAFLAARRLFDWRARNDVVGRPLSPTRVPQEVAT
jgi:hypothetical protein